MGFLSLESLNQSDCEAAAVETKRKYSRDTKYKYLCSKGQEYAEIMTLMRSDLELKRSLILNFLPRDELLLAHLSRI